MKRSAILASHLIAAFVVLSAPLALADPDDAYPFVNKATKEFFGPMAVESLILAAQHDRLGDWAKITTGDTDYYLMICGKPPGSQGVVGSVRVNLTSSIGDLDMEVYTVDGTFIGASRGTTNREQVNVASAGKSIVVMKVYGYNGAVNGYGLGITCQ